MIETKPDTPSVAGFSFRREFAAPRDLVWQAMTQEAHLTKWMASRGDREAPPLQVKTFDLRPGGEFLFCNQQPGGPQMWQKYAYREVQAPEKLVYVYSFSNEAGEVMPNPWMPGMPLQILTEIVLEEVDGKTLMTFSAAPFDATAEQQAAYASAKEQFEWGAKSAYEGLAGYLAKLA